MNGVFERGVLLSLPGRELGRIAPPASVFPIEALEAASLPAPLRDALDLVRTCAPPPRLIVARPEMFSEGETLAWLRQAIGDVRDHVALSDGETVRLIPGLQNHVFFYHLGAVGALDALARLECRAPELFAQLASQVNTALRFRENGRRVAPPTQALVADPAPAAAFERRPLALHRHGLKESVDATRNAAPMAPGASFERLQYLRLSESALGEAAVARRLCACVADALVDPHRAVVIVLPTGADEARGVAALMQALFCDGGRLPGGLATNVFWTLHDLSVAALDALAPRRTLICDDFADFSRLAPGFPEAFAKILVHARTGRHMPSQFHELLASIYGPQVEIEWLRPQETLAGATERTRRL